MEFLIVMLILIGLFVELGRKKGPPKKIKHSTKVHFHPHKTQRSIERLVKEKKRGF